MVEESATAAAEEADNGPDIAPQNLDIQQKWVPAKKECVFERSFTVCPTFSRGSCKKGTQSIFFEPRFLRIPGDSRDSCRNAQPRDIEVNCFILYSTTEGQPASQLKYVYWTLFFMKRRIPLDPESSRTLIVLFLTCSPELTLGSGILAQSEHVFQPFSFKLVQFRSNFFD